MAEVKLFNINAGSKTHEVVDPIIAKLLRMRREGMMAKREVSGDWGNFQKYYRGKMWPDKRPKYRIPAVINMIQQLIERKAALLTDTKPTMRVETTFTDTNAPLRPMMETVARVLEKYILSVWEDRSLDSRLAEAIILAEVLGSVGINTLFDKRLGKFGDIDIMVVDPRSFLFDPFVTKPHLLRNAEYMIYEDVVATDWIRDQFPHARDRVKPSNGLGLVDSDSDSPGSFSDKIRRLFGFTAAAQKTNAVDRTIVSEFWIKDRERDEEGKAIYPGGRHILVADITGSRVILDDSPNPYYDNEFPIELLNWHMDINNAWGFGDIELYESPQLLFNKLIALIVENAVLMNNSIWIGDQDALSPRDWNKLSNEPGFKVKIRPGRSLRREPPTPFDAGSIGLLNFLLGGMEKLSGISEVLEGRRPGQVTSGIAIESLQTAAQVVIRLKARYLENLLTRVGQKMISRIFQYISDDRIFTITGDLEMVKAYHHERMRVLNDPINAFADYKFRIIPGSSLAITKWQKGLLASQLHAQGIIDGRAVLDALEYPRRDEILARKAEQDAASLQLQMLLSQVGGQTTSSGKKGGTRSTGKVPKASLRSPELALQQRVVAGAPDVKKGSQGE